MSKRILIALMLIVSVIVAGCGPRRSSNSITVAGSTSVQPVAELMAERFSEKGSEIQVNVQGGGSSAGITAVKNGTADIGTSSRELQREEEEGIEKYEVARDGIVVVVNPKNSVLDLSKEQVRDIFSGKIRNWSQLGGKDQKILVVVREEGSGTRGAFEEIVMAPEKLAIDSIVQGSTGAVRQTVSSDPAAIGFISMASISSEVKAVKVDGARPDTESILSGAYKLARPFYFLTKGEPQGAIKDFIDYALGEEGKAVAKEAGLVTN